MLNETKGVAPKESPWLDVLGPLVRVLTDDREGDYACLLGTLGPGVMIPLHTHEDRETFFVLTGSAEGYVGDRWHTVAKGEVLDIQGDVLHAWRNATNEETTFVIVTTNKMKRFFEEIGTPPPEFPSPPSPDVLARVTEVAGRYGYWLASPEENRAIGLPF